MSFVEDVIKQVRDYDASRPRSQQTAVGWSEVGGCRAYLGYKLGGAWASDDADSWAAVRGTAIHSLLETVLAGPGVHTEVTTSYRGVLGHADLLVDPASASVTDHKTTSLANSRLWAEDHDLLWQKRVQAHGYAAGLIGDGRLPEDCTVRILVIPVDGTYADWWAYEEPFDRAIADWGADRLDDVRDRLGAGEELPKDKPYKWCMSYCQFFSLCRGSDDPQAAETIADPDTVAAVAGYASARDEESAARKRKVALGNAIRGLHGVAGDYRIGLSEPGDPEDVMDVSAVLADYEARGEKPPMTTKAGAAPRLSVTRVKRAAKA